MILPENRPLTYLITTGDLTDGNFRSGRLRLAERVRSAVESGVSLIQIREKNLSAYNLFDLATELTQITSNTDTRLLINDRADVAKAARADGVHLTGRSLSPTFIRKIFGGEFLIGVSTHSVDEIRSAFEGGADFVVFGPVFSVPGKEEPIGVDILDEVCDEFGLFPVIAIGGINETNFSSVLETKTSGFAAIRALNDDGSMRRMMDKIGKVQL